eukprot:g46484.t1
MLPGEHQQVLSSLQEHLRDFLEDSQESEVFSVTDGNQLEREVKFCKQYYEDLLKSAEREEQEESACNRFISELRNIRLRVENCEKRLIREIRTPLERDDLQESVQRITEQEKLKSELEELIVDLEKVTEKCDKFFGQASSSSAATLRTELNVVLQNLNQQWRTEVDEKRDVFHSLEDELQKGKAVSERMLRAHNERDMDMDWHKEKAVQLAERWENIRSQIDNRTGNFDRSPVPQYYTGFVSLEYVPKDLKGSSSDNLQTQQEPNQEEEVLASEVEMKQSRMDECQKYSDEYSSAVK